MKRLTVSFYLIAALLSFSCSPAGSPPTAAEETPTATAGEAIHEMDFESGETEGTVEPAETDNGEQE